jgi:hypothetical protein
VALRVIEPSAYQVPILQNLEGMEPLQSAELISQFQVAPSQQINQLSEASVIF